MQELLHYAKCVIMPLLCFRIIIGSLHNSSCIMLNVSLYKEMVLNVLRS